MPDLDEACFRGSGDIPVDIAGKLITAGIGDNDSRTLTQLGWEGQTIGYVGLVLTPDGAGVSRAQFCLRGKLTENTVIFQAAKLWEKVAKDVTVNIEPMDGQCFRFLSGTLFSDYAPQEAFKISYYKADQKIRAGEEHRHNIGKLCFRLFCHLDKTSNARQGQGPHWKLTTLAFPHAVEELEEETQLTMHPSWPGIKILEGKAGFFPRAETVLWGCPIFPLLSAENRAAAVNSIPSGAVLRAAIAGLCSTAALPTACTTRPAALKKKQEIITSPPAQQGREPTVKWPSMTMPPATEGRISFFTKLINITVNI
jgi:hypothetical protein